MKILSVNAGSSSLKFQLYEMPEEKVLISGVVERIGIENSFYTVKINGEKVAIYKDTNGKEHIVYNRCPHMKCGIVFNEVENTWDCLCHGSRFDLDGKCIEGPSNYDISFK